MDFDCCSDLFAVQRHLYSVGISYFTAELKEGAPFTKAGADRIKQLGIMQIVLSVVSWAITDGIYEKIGLSKWNRFDDASGITLGIGLIFIAMVVRYGAELEHRKQS